MASGVLKPGDPREFTIGEHSSMFHGTGFDFVGLRDWQAGESTGVERLPLYAEASAPETIALLRLAAGAELLGRLADP